MDERHRRLLGEEEADDADARGEHDYTAAREKPHRNGAENHVVRQRRAYVAGADGTQEIVEPEEPQEPEEPS